MRRLSGLDGAFLAFESPTMHLHVAAVMVFEASGVSPDTHFRRIRAAVEERLDLVPSFRQRAVPVPFGIEHATLVDDPDFDLDAHVRRIAVPAPGGPAELSEVVSELVGRPLDRSRPLWEFDVLEGLEGGRSALVTKVHHALVDGVAGAELIAAFLDLTAERGGREDPGPAPWEPGPVRGDLDALSGAVTRLPARGELLVRTALRTVRSLRELTVSNRHTEGILPPAPFSAPRTSLNRTIGPERRVAFATVPAEALEEIRSTLPGSINDLAMTMVAGSLRRYFEHLGETQEASLVAMVPVSTRGTGTDHTAANRVSAMLVSLASTVADPEARLKLISAAARRAKAQSAAIGTEVIASWADAFLPAVAQRVSRLAASFRVFDRVRPPCNAIVSNVPGPPMDLYFAGNRLESLHPVGPIAEGVGVNVTLFSYRGALQFGVNVARNLCQDAGVIASGIEAEAEALVRVARLRGRSEPWWHAHDVGAVEAEPEWVVRQVARRLQRRVGDGAADGGVRPGRTAG